VGYERDGAITLAMNTALEGKTYEPVTLEIDAGFVARFASAVGDDGSFVPPTIVTTPEIVAGLDHLVADEDLGLDFSRVVHGDQEYEWLRPLRGGDVLVVESTIESIRFKGGHEFLTLRTEMRDVAGEMVVVARTGLIVRGES
jgi:MaoC dehydratase-like protein